MKSTTFIIYYLLLLLIQLFLAKYVQIGPFLYFCLIPAMILSFPTALPSYLVMLFAFLTGISVDILADGVLGLNAAAATLCAALQKGVIRLMVDPDIVERHYVMSYKRYGVIRILSALALFTLVYFTMYVIADNAGLRGIGFISTRIVLSSLVSLPLGAAVISILCPYQR